MGNSNLCVYNTWYTRTSAPGSFPAHEVGTRHSRKFISLNNDDDNDSCKNVWCRWLFLALAKSTTIAFFFNDAFCSIEIIWMFNVKSHTWLSIQIKSLFWRSVCVGLQSIVTMKVKNSLIETIWYRIVLCKFVQCRQDLNTNNRFDIFAKQMVQIQHFSTYIRTKDKDV